MDRIRCPRCGWPVDELDRKAGSVHPVSRGVLSYRRCVCGSWLLQVNDVIVGATAGDGIAAGATPLR
jgi:hypothetical protein